MSLCLPSSQTMAVRSKSKENEPLGLGKAYASKTGSSPSGS